MATHTKPRPVRRTAGDFARGFGALLALAGLLAGIPAALITFTGWPPPLPSTVPTPNDILTAITTRDDGTLLIAAITWVAWLGWATFAISVLVEIPAAFRGVRAPRLPALGIQQRLAAVLIAAIAALFTSTAAAAAAPTATPAPASTASVTAAAVDPADDTPQAAAAGQPEGAEGGTIVHTVVEGDTLSGIAHDHLGNAHRWPEIYEDNRGAPQQVGGTLTDPDLIYPGQQLDIPADAGPARSATDELAPGSYLTVVEGDTLSGIAHDHLGNAHRWPEIYEDNRGAPQQVGGTLTDPDLIHPGWVLRMPDDAHGERITVVEPASSDVTEPEPGENAEAETDAAPAGDPDAVGDEPAADSDAELSAESAPAPAPLAVPQPPVADTSGTDTTAESPAIDSHDADTVAEPVDDEQTGQLPIRTIGGIGALAAAGILTYLGIARHRQQQRRKAGERIAMPPAETDQVETELRQVADPGSADLIDRALRTLTAGAAQTGQPLPAVRFARLLGSQLELYLTGSGEMGYPFTAANPERTLWVLDPDADILDAAEAANWPAPYPSLVTLGHDADGGHALVNLEQIGALAIESPTTADAGEIITALAVDLATSQWGDELRVTLVGADTNLASSLINGRIRTLDTVDQVLDDAETRARADRDALDTVGADTLSAARAGGVAEGSWAPEIYLIAAELTDHQHARLTQLVHDLPRVAIAAVTTGGQSIGEWVLQVGDDPNHGTLEPGGYSITPQRLTAGDHDRLIQLLAATGAEPTPAEPTWQVDTRGEPAIDDIPVAGPAAEVPFVEITEQESENETAPSTDEPGAEVEQTHQPPVVAVLGPVEVQNVADPAEPTKRGQLTALAAFLAFNPGSSREAVDQALWPGHRVTVATRNTTMTKLRNWLGSTPDGEDYLPRVTGDGYRLHPAIPTDWQWFCDLVPDGPAKATTSGLTAALDLVRGQPFSGVNPNKYAWAERTKQEFISAIVDVADELAQRHLREGDHRAALCAVSVGHLADPGSELLWRHRLRAHHTANDLEALRQAADHLTALADQLGSDLDPETTDLLSQLLDNRPRAVAI